MSEVLAAPRDREATWSAVFSRYQWRKLDAVTLDAKGGEVFRQNGIEVPGFWSDAAARIVAEKYFRGSLGAPEREYSVRQLVRRVVDAIALHGVREDYFDDSEVERFVERLAALLIEQRMAFNSPVWFNVGTMPAPQISACFLLSVDDELTAIADWYKEEMLVFRGGSGAGVNLSKLRGSKERLHGGGIASGPVSFMRAADASAGSLRSGGKTRRAAKLVCLDDDHPDLLDFIRCKAEEEKKAHALVDAGWDGSFNVPGGAYESVSYQNANHSVRVTDSFMRAIAEDRPEAWKPRNRIDHAAPLPTASVREVFDEIVKAAWICGDPGLHFSDKMEYWHTCPESGRISTTNPCTEFVHVDNTSCNLASLNLLRYFPTASTSLDEFDVTGFQQAVELTALAMEILVDLGGFPSEKIAKATRSHRPLGVNYTNLGAVFMAHGVAYDSPEARDWAAAVTALLTGTVYATSAEIARVKGAFEAFDRNRDAMLCVIEHHADAAERLGRGKIADAARSQWRSALAVGRSHGFRNSQASALAPTGTISFMMDADTTGVEPELALVKYKSLVGGGSMKIVNSLVPRALSVLGYNGDAAAIVKRVEETGQPEGLRPEHLPVFATSFGDNQINWRGHLKMMAAVQPFVSGAISKTVNLPSDATIEDIANVYIEAWRLGLKAVAVYRDGCKRTQPLSTEQGAASVRAARRFPLPDERESVTHKYSVGGHDGYITVGKYEDGKPGEMFLVAGKEGGLVSGLMDAFATSVSLGLQYGVPLKAFVDKFSHMRFEPSGFTNNERIPQAKSIVDYLFRWMALKFLPAEDHAAIGFVGTDGELTPARGVVPVKRLQSDAPPCSSCGSVMERRGTCYYCPNCAATSGCS